MTVISKSNRQSKERRQGVSMKTSTRGVWFAAVIVGLFVGCATTEKPVAAGVERPAKVSAGEFYQRDGVAIAGYDPVAFFTEGKALRGASDHSAVYQGSTFYFTSAANRDAFRADPDKYAPQYRGFCAFGVASGYKAAVDPTAFTIVDGKLYLNYNSEVKTMWSADIAGFLVKSEKNWPEVSLQSKVAE
jgi:YHS domain-containing protein